MKISHKSETELKGSIDYRRLLLIGSLEVHSLFKMNWNYNDFHRNAAKQICFLITVHSSRAENIAMGGFTKIRSQTSINFISLWCTLGELNSFDTLK